MARDRTASASPSKRRQRTVSNAGSATAAGDSGLVALLDSLVALKEPKTGRDICDIFMELPSRAEYPDYYDAIKSPICLNDIRQRVRTGRCSHNNDFKRDIDLLVSNAQLYNRPGSVVYRDATTIQKFVDKNLQALVAVPVKETTPAAPAVQKDAVKEKVKAEEEEEPIPADNEFGKILAGIRKMTAAGGRRICELFEELPSRIDYPDYYDIIKTPIALSDIRKKILADKYTLFDDMEKDILQMVDNAKKFNEPNSQVHKDALEIMNQFYKLAGMKPEESKFNQPLDEFFIRKQRFEVGDFVLINNDEESPATDGQDEDSPKPNVGIIYRIWKNLRGQSTFSANLFLRPEQIVHPVSRKFYKNEVFKSEVYVEHTSSAVAGRCHVMLVKDFARGRPYGMPKDMQIFVCESRYAAKRTAPVKMWKMCLPEAVRDDEPPPLVPFDRPLVVEKTEPSPFLPKHLQQAAQQSKPAASADGKRQRKRQGSEQPAKDDDASSADGTDADPAADNSSDGQDEDDDDDDDNYSRRKRPRKASVPPPRRAGSRPPAGVPAQSAATAATATAQPLFNIAGLNAVGTSMAAKLPSSFATLPEETVAQFRTRDGQVVWSSAPPMLVVRKPAAPVHSLEYLQFKYRKQQQQMANSAVSETSVPLTTATTTVMHDVTNVNGINAPNLAALASSLRQCAADLRRDAAALQAV